MSDETLKLWRIQECGYEQGVKQAEAYVAAVTQWGALALFAKNCGELKGVNIEAVELPFYYSGAGA